MKIQWNSEAAQDVLKRLKQSEDGLEEGMQRARHVRVLLDKANDEGDEKVLTRLSEAFEESVRRLQALLQELEEFRNAVRHCDAEFEEAENSINVLLRNLETDVALRMGDAYKDSANWEPKAYAVMPDMRVRAAPVPSWLDQITATRSVL